MHRPRPFREVTVSAASTCATTPVVLAVMVDKMLRVWTASGGRGAFLRSQVLSLGESASATSGTEERAGASRERPLDRELTGF